MPISGTPMAEANFAAESKSEVAKLRSRAGNHRPMALAFAGNVGASPTPSRKRAAKKPPRLGVAAAANDAALVGHLQKEQVGQLLDVVPVIDAIVPQGMAEDPKFLYNVAHAAIAALISLMRCGRVPAKTLVA